MRSSKKRRGNRDSGGQGKAAVRSSGVISRGTIRIEGSDVQVKLLLVEGTFALMTDTVEIGTWSAPDVTVQPRGDGRFEIAVDGDAVDYFPEDPGRFSKHEIVSKPHKGGVFRRRKTVTAEPAEGAPPPGDPETTEPQPTQASLEPGPELHALEITETGTTEPAPAGEPASERRAKTKGTAAARIAEIRARAAAGAQPEMKPTVPTGKRIRGSWDPPVALVKTAQVSDRVARHASKRIGPWKQQAAWRLRLAWYWILENLGRIDVFPFNRLPNVTPDMRLRPGHQHTFEAHTATSGLNRHVCTSCGLVQVKAAGED